MNDEFQAETEEFLATVMPQVKWCYRYDLKMLAMETSAVGLCAGLVEVFIVQLPVSNTLRIDGLCIASWSVSGAMWLDSLFRRLRQVRRWQNHIKMLDQLRRCTNDTQREAMMDQLHGNILGI